ncbi:histone H1 [Triplophysa dalaica]|uniref:histone H1 n=1 Tax=Triplophysa dalaica TaxID=1582913 RepID=UPI0024DF5912|nr:histone H1 [Triplophysa dalaica]
MAETAPAPATAPAKAPKKKTVKAKKSGPSVSDLIVETIAASNERKGVSLAALKKALAGNGYDVEKNNSRVKLALKSLVKKGSLVQTKGTGASGSFKVSKKPAAAKQPVKKVAAKPKKPAVKKAPVKAAKPKKAAVKKSAVKKSPRKVKKPATPKKAAKSPKKVKKPAVKKVAKSPKKTKAAKPKAAKPKAAKPKAAKAKKAAKKK